MTKKESTSKTIHLTFDYELFFEKSGTPQKCILEPTDKLLAVFKENNLKGTFFIDVLYYLRLIDQVSTREDAYKIRQQLQEIVSQGSRIELHLHPHWFDAHYKQGEWQFPSYEKYRLHSLNEGEIQDLFVSGIQVIEEIAKEVISDYKVRAFRAGGFCLQPFDKLLQGFLKSGIQIDSSVAPGMVDVIGPQIYNFDMAPDQDGYTFLDNPAEVYHGGPFVELPIATYRVNLASKIISKVIRKCNGTQVSVLGDGRGISSPHPWWNKFLPEMRMITLDGYVLPDGLARQLNVSKREIVTIISHPKSLTSFSFECLERLIADRHSFVQIEEAVQILQQSSRISTVAFQ